MSTSSSTARHSASCSAPSPASSLDPGRLTELAVSLHEAAQALLAVAVQPLPAPQAAPRAALEPEPGPAAPVQRELRCYSVPRFIAEFEKEVLEAHHAEDLCDLFRLAYGDLHVTTYLMEHFSSAEKVSDITVQMIGQSLRSALHILNKACDVLADFTLVEQPATA